MPIREKKEESMTDSFFLSESHLSANSSYAPAFTYLFSQVFTIHISPLMDGTSSQFQGLGGQANPLEAF